MRGLLSLLALLSITALSGPLLAADDYKPYVGGGEEQVSAPLFVIISYSVIWVFLMLFVLSIWIRQRRVAVELEQVRRQLEE